MYTCNSSHELSSVLPQMVRLSLETILPILDIKIGSFIKRFFPSSMTTIAGLCFSYSKCSSNQFRLFFRQWVCLGRSLFHLLCIFALLAVPVDPPTRVSLIKLLSLPFLPVPPLLPLLLLCLLLLLLFELPFELPWYRLLDNECESIAFSTTWSNFFFRYNPPLPSLPVLFVVAPLATLFKKA